MELNPNMFTDLFPGTFLMASVTQVKSRGISQ